MKSNKNTGKFSAKGYYIALILCAAAIGISGYLYYQNANDKNPSLQGGAQDSTVLSPTGDDIQAVAPGTDATGSTATDGSESTKPSVHKSLKTCKPLEGETICDYAMDCLAYNETTRDWRVHDGIDIAAEAGTKVCAAADGTVYTTYTDDSMGTTVVIRHEGGYVTVYASLAEDVQVSTGDTVTMGQTIGTVGSTALLETAIGDHLHFSVTCDSQPMDPEDFFGLE